MIVARQPSYKEQLGQGNIICTIALCEDLCSVHASFLVQKVFFFSDFLFSTALKVSTFWEDKAVDYEMNFK